MPNRVNMPTCPKLRKHGDRSCNRLYEQGRDLWLAIEGELCLEHAVLGIHPAPRGTLFSIKQQFLAVGP